MDTPKFSIYNGNCLKIEDKKISIVFLDDVILVEADGNYCDIYTKDQTFKSIRGQIGQMWDMINKVKYPHNLERVSRSFILKLDLLKEIDPRKGTATFRIDRKLDPIPIGKTPAKELLKYLKKGKRIEVLDAFAKKLMLNVSIDELNDTHEYEKGLECVDLGLTSGTQWATTNLSAPHADLTEYYSWGQLNLNDSYDEEGYWHTPSELLKVDLLPLKNDVAHQDWGGGWRLPTKEDFEELEKECLLTWCVVGSERRHGILVTGPNGNCIFLPSTGKKDGVKIVSEKDAVYWTATNNKNFPHHAEAALFMDIDDENNKASLLLYDEEWFKGLSIRPVLKERTSPEAPNKKTILRFHDFNMVFDDWHFHESNINHGWRFADLDIPVDPQKAMKLIKKLCEKYSPDVVIGIGTGGFLVHQLKDYKRICVNPDFHPSESFPVGTYPYEDYNRDDLGEDFDGDYVTFEITDDIHQQFLEMEKNQFDNVDDENCWGLFWNLDDDNAEEFDEHYSNIIEMSDLKKGNPWDAVILIPLIKEIAK